MHQKTEYCALLVKCRMFIVIDYDYESYEEYDDYESDNYENGSYEWTEEDSWDALTDGMYGDMPKNPWDYDAMMDAMGF